MPIESHFNCVCLHQVCSWLTAASSPTMHLPAQYRRLRKLIYIFDHDYACALLTECISMYHCIVWSVSCVLLSNACASPLHFGPHAKSPFRFRCRLASDTTEISPTDISDLLTSKDPQNWVSRSYRLSGSSIHASRNVASLLRPSARMQSAEKDLTDTKTIAGRFLDIIMTTDTVFASAVPVKCVW